MSKVCYPLETYAHLHKLLIGFREGTGCCVWPEHDSLADHPIPAAQEICVRVAHYKIETFRRVEAVRVSAYWTRVGWPSATEMAEEVTLKTKRHDLTTLEFVMSVNGVDITEETWPVLQQSYKDEINIKVILPYKWNTSYSPQMTL